MIKDIIFVMSIRNNNTVKQDNMQKKLNTIENVWYHTKGKDFPVSVMHVKGKSALVKPVNPQLQLGTFAVRLSSLYNPY